jgi:uncharacterized protein
MSEINQLVDRYMQLWHEANAELRREGIAELFVEDGVQFLSSREFHGCNELEERIASAHKQFVQEGGFVFRPSGNVAAHHNAVKLNWEMVPASGGEVAAVGTIFLLLNDDGRIRQDYQF